MHAPLIVLLALVPAGASAALERSLSFPPAGLTSSGGCLLAWGARGEYDLFDVEARRPIAAGRSLLNEIVEAVPTDEGFLLRGKLDEAGRTFSAVVLLEIDGEIREIWQSTEISFSRVVAGVNLATVRDSQGRWFDLEPGGGLKARLALRPEDHLLVDGSVRVVCNRAICRKSPAPAWVVRGQEIAATVVCGDALVVDVVSRPGASRRETRRLADGKLIRRVALTRASSALWCAEGQLVIQATSSRALEPRRILGPCANGQTRLVHVLGRHIACTGADSKVRMVAAPSG